MKRNGDKVDTGTDSALRQLLNELVAIDVEFVQIEAKHVKMPGMAAVFFVWRSFEFLDVYERFVIEANAPNPGFDETLELSELMDSD